MAGCKETLVDKVELTSTAIYIVRVRLRESTTLAWYPYQLVSYRNTTVEPPNKGHFGANFLSLVERLSEVK